MRDKKMGAIIRNILAAVVVAAIVTAPGVKGATALASEKAAPTAVKNTVTAKDKSSKEDATKEETIKEDGASENDKTGDVTDIKADTEEKAIEAEEAVKSDEETITEEPGEGADAVIDEEENLTEQEKAERDHKAAKLALQNDPTHVHHFEWIAKMNASESAEGTINYMCIECDKVWYFRPINAYRAFEGDVAWRIRDAVDNATINVKTSLFINFNKEVMEALAERPDVTLHVSFLEDEYKGNRVSFTIPAGEDTVALLDDEGYCGFKYLGGIYGLKLEEIHTAPVTEGEDEAAADATTEAAKDATTVAATKATTEATSDDATDAD